MKKIFFVLFLFITSIYGQDKTIDSLHADLKKHPNDFYRQRNILDYCISVGNTKELEGELSRAKVQFKNNKDYYTYFTICEMYVYLLKGEMETYEKKLNQYAYLLKEKDLPLTQIHLYFFQGYLHVLKDQQSLANVNFGKSLMLVRKNNLDKKHFLNFYLFYSNTLIMLGEYDEALKILFEMLTIKELERKFDIYNSIGVCYYNLKQFNQAEHYYKIAVEGAEQNVKNQLASNLAILYLERKKIEEAETLIKSLNFNTFSSTDTCYVYNVMNEIEQRKMNYNKAFEYLFTVAKIEERLDNKRDLATTYLSLGDLYIKSNQLKNADQYYKKSYDLLKEFEDENAMKTLLSSIVKNEFRKCKNLEGERYFLEFLTLNDSISSKEVQRIASHMDTKYQTAEKEAKIKEQELQLEKEKLRKNQLYYGIGLLSLLGLGVYVWNRNRQKRKNLESENALLDMKSNLAQMELQNLNQQLDPHEFKNMLQVLAPEIQVKAPEAYKNLIQLLQLTKAALNNKSITDSLENQLQQIDSYLSIEKKIVPHPLSWEIVNKATRQEIQLPRLLLKNMVENAVKHGVKNLTTEGKILVEVTEVGKFIILVIDDNGVGRKQSVSLDSGIGTSTYFKLFETLNVKNKHKAVMQIIDKEVGTRVEINIPLDYQY